MGSRKTSRVILSILPWSEFGDSRAIVWEPLAFTDYRRHVTELRSVTFNLALSDVEDWVDGQLLNRG